MRSVQNNGVKSIEVGSRLIQALVESAGAMTLKDLAGASNMMPGKAHRYLVSFVRTGLVRQDPRTKRYMLGNMAFQIGLAAIGRDDPLARAVEIQASLRDRIDKTVVLSVWGSHGPVIVNVKENSHPVIMTMRVGATLPMLATAAGLVCGAFLPRIVTSKIIKSELLTIANAMPGTRTMASVERVLASVKKAGFATNKGHLTNGVGAVAVPLLGWHGQLVAVMSVIGREENLNMRSNGAIANQLRIAARQFLDGYSEFDA